MPNRLKFVIILLAGLFYSCSSVGDKMKYQQTGVDSQLSTTSVAIPDGPCIDPAYTQMVFYNIEEDSFIWDWERSSDDGETWTLLWRIEYTRKM